MIVAGAVNGVPTKADVSISGSNVAQIFINRFDIKKTLAVQTDGSGIRSPNHRVAIIGGPIVGRDHFPYPIGVTDAGGPLPNPIYPFGLSAKDYCEIFYKVKRWKMRVDVAYTSYDDTPRSGGATVVWEPTFAPTGGDQLALNSEADIVVGNRSLDFAWDHEEGYSSGHPIIVSADFDGDAFAGYNITFGYSDPKWYAPTPSTTPLWFEFGIRVVGDGEWDCDTSLSYPRQVGNFRLRDYTDNLIGSDVPILAPNLSGGRGINSCNVTIKPALFWPYATKSGAAVYNITTGKPLADPLG